MQVIAFTDPLVGSLDWELPPGLAEKMATELNPEERAFILETIQLHLKAHLHTLLAAVQLGPRASAAMALLNEVGIIAALEIREMLK